NGVRKNDLSDAFRAHIAAIGFACTVDSIKKALDDQALTTSKQLDVELIYEQAQMAEAIQLTRALRDAQYRVISHPTTKHTDENQCWQIEVSAARKTAIHQEKEIGRAW